MLLNKKRRMFINKLKLNEEDKLNWKYIDLKIRDYRYHCLTPFGCTKLEFAENNNEPLWLLHTCLIELYKTFHTNVHGCRLIIPLHYRSEWPRLFVYTVSRLHLKFKANRPSYCMTAHTSQDTYVRRAARWVPLRHSPSVWIARTSTCERDI